MAFRVADKELLADHGHAHGAGFCRKNRSAKCMAPQERERVESHDFATLIAIIDTHRKELTVAESNLVEARYGIATPTFAEHRKRLQIKAAETTRPSEPL